MTGWTGPRRSRPSSARRLRAGSQAAEPLAQERVRVRGGVGGQDGDPLGVGVAVPLLPAARGPDAGGRGEPGPGHQRLRGREAAHVQADLRDQRGGGLPAQAGDLIQPLRGRQRGSTSGPPGQAR